MRTSQAGRDLVKAWEGIEDGDPTTVNLDPYLDIAGRWTIGWGHLILGHEDFSTGITTEQAEALLTEDLHEAEAAVNRLVRVPLSQPQFDALVSFTFNLGVRALQASTLLLWLNEGRYLDAPQQITRWNKAADPATGNKVSVLGLTRRRIAECDMFLRGC